MNHWTQVGHTLLYTVVYSIFDCLTYTDACIYINIVKISEDGNETEIDTWRLEVNITFMWQQRNTEVLGLINTTPPCNISYIIFL